MIDEGYIKFVSVWLKTPPLQHPEIDELIRWRRPLFAAGLVGYYEDGGVGFGNISMRIAPGEGDQFIITATQTGHLPELGREHFSLVTAFDLERNEVHCSGAAEASSESLTHAAIYRLDARINAIVHVHSRKLWSDLRGQVATTNPEVSYGTPEMAREFGRLFEETDFSDTGIAVMAGHDEGLVATGSSLGEAAEKILSLNTASASSA